MYYSIMASKVLFRPKLKVASVEIVLLKFTNTALLTYGHLLHLYLFQAMSEEGSLQIDIERSRFPYCIVWTPLPFLTWLIPIIGHMGIATSSGVIRDFAGPYFVSEDNMAFGKPTKYWPLDSDLVLDGKKGWDEAISKASNIYGNRMHNLICDNCHSHVSCALNNMKYNDKSNYNMVKTFLLFTYNCKYVSFCHFLKTWLPFFVIVIIVAVLVYYTH